MGLSIWIDMLFIKNTDHKKIKEKNEFLSKLIVDGIEGFRVVSR